MRRFLPLLVLAVFLPFPSLRSEEKKPLAPKDAKAALLKLLDRPKAPADLKDDADPVAKGGLVYTRWSFASEKKADGTIERVPGLAVRPADTKVKLPVMIVLHGTG